MHEPRTSDEKATWSWCAKSAVLEMPAVST